MIRRARTSGHLSLPLPSLEPWAKLNGATFNGIQCAEIPGSGSGVVAERDLRGATSGDEKSVDGDGPLMTVPKELILSLDSVKMFALADRDLREVLEGMGDFARTTRGAIMIFLLTQATTAYPELKEPRIGTRTPFTEYIQFLPTELLPTSWTSDERYLLTTTTLHPATDAKQASLHREFETLHKATKDVKWCADTWWNPTSPTHLDVSDWKFVDSMYRSRALEYPGIGDAMVPCIDMANHAAGSDTIALYEMDGEGNAVLVLREGVSVRKGDEVTITYGDAKGACEMVFSYGFIDDAMVREGDAKELFLDLEMMGDDPLAMAKNRVSTAAPGVKLMRTDEGVEWVSEYVYLIVVNEEDGLEFEVLQTTDGGRELRVSWKGDSLSDIGTLPSLLEKEELWPVFQLRAAAIIQARVEEQLASMEAFSDELQNIRFGEGTDIREKPRDLAVKLHVLEKELCRKASQALAMEVEALSGTEIVKRYIAEMNGGGEPDEEVDLS
ncbi:hypothetical protein FKW77_004690 [Venturia effusa]|uniref:SET domain-containing protein n=1 Tax=Venturia effusa TaxID=50376 RepID=A0A517LK23_9PEZI|nr:hypothetical protein FKW77_004690 [Venturia effusa]